MSAKQEACVNIQWQVAVTETNEHSLYGRWLLLWAVYMRNNIIIIRLLNGHGIWTRGITLMKDVVLSGWSSPFMSHNRDGLTSGIGIRALCCLRLLLLWTWALLTLECKLCESRDFCLFCSWAFSPALRKASDTADTFSPSFFVLP